MRKTISIISILINLLAVNAYCQKNNSDCILLIRYNEYSECTIVEGNNEKIEPENYDDFIEDIDDYSDFFSTQKVFYYDGDIELTEEDQIIFWEYGYKKTISKLPYNHSLLKIESSLNDTTLNIKIQDKQMELKVNTMVTDTVFYQKKEDGQVVECQTIICIENLGLIEKKNVIDNKTWDTKKFELGLDAPVIVEVMPEFNGGQEKFMEYLAKNINYSSYNESTEIINTKLYIEFIINETGDVARAKVLRSIHPSFDKHVIELLENMPKWKPGRQDGKPVPVKMMLPLNIDFR